MHSRLTDGTAPQGLGSSCTCWLPGAFLQSQGLLHLEVWDQLRATQIQSSDCRLLAFLKLVAAGLSYQSMPSKRSLGPEGHFGSMPGDEL